MLGKLCILGAKGSGKTHLARYIAELIPMSRLIDDYDQNRCGPIPRHNEWPIIITATSVSKFFPIKEGEENAWEDLTTGSFELWFMHTGAVCDAEWHKGLKIPGLRGRNVGVGNILCYHSGGKVWRSIKKPLI